MLSSVETHMWTQLKVNMVSAQVAKARVMTEN